MSPLEGALHTGPSGAGVSRPGLVLSAPLIAVAAVLSAVAAAVDDAAPTASALADSAWLALLGASVALAGAKAHRATLIVLSALAGVTTTGLTQGLAAAALVAVVAWELFGSGAVGRDLAGRGLTPVLGAVVAAVGVNALLRGDVTVGSEGVTLALSVVAVGSVLASGIAASSRPVRRVALALGAVIGVGCIVLAGLAALVVLSARTDLEQGVSAARSGLDLAIDGGTDGATPDSASIEAANTQFATAETLLRRGHRQLARSWARPALGLPIVGPNLHATTELAATAIDVSAAANQVSAAADPGRFTVTDSRIDLSLILDTRPHLIEARRSLSAALDVVDEVRSPWLLSPLTSRIDTLTEAAADALPTIDDLIAIADTAPPMLGHDGPRTYLVLFTAPSETRGIGGFVGHWGLLTTDDGRLDLVDSGRLSELGGPPGTHDRTLSGPQEYLDRYYRYYVESYLVNITASPDFPTVAEVAAELFPQAGLPPIDGVILVDPSAVSALATITGPLSIPSRPEPLDAESLEQFLWLDQYIEFGGDDRVDALAELIDAMFGALTTSSLDPNQVLDALGPMVADKRLMVWSADPDEASVLAHFGLDGAFPRVQAGIDLLSVRTANANGNKIDVYLQRQIDHQATVDPDTGAIDATVTVTLTNHAVDDPDLPDYVLGNFDPDLPRATNRQWVTLYTPHQLTHLTVDGAPEVPETLPELGVLAHALYVDIAPGATTTITFSLSGTVAPDYRLIWSGQPTVRPDELTFDISTGGGPITISTTTSTDLDLSADR